MDSIYRDNILDHYKNPRNYGSLKKFDIKSEVGNPSCGDKIGMEIKFKDKNSDFKTIDDIKFSGEGCAISTASASMLTEFVKNKNIQEIQKINTSDILKLLGIILTPSRVRCALLSLEVLQKALSLEKRK